MVAPRLTPAQRARPQGVFWLAFGVLLAFAAQQLWHRFGRQEIGDPIATSLVAFEKQNRLTVFSAQLAPVVAADDARLFGMIKARQVAVIPARVDYTLDLSKMDRAAFRWDKDRHQLDVTLPPLAPSRPDLDEGRAQYLREGVWIGREAQAKLTHDNTLLAERQAAEAAASPVLLELARDAAKAAVRQNLSIPLQLAGYGDVSVTVHFTGERPGN